MLNSLEVKDYIKQCESVQKSVNLDNDDNDDDGVGDNFCTDVNSKYVDIKQLNSTKVDLSSTFGLLHINIASINKHIDDLRFILSQINFNFDIIGISEHKILKDTAPSNNITISGYDEFKFEPTETNYGGTGFDIKDNLDYILRKDLQINSPTHYESMFIEIIFPNRNKINCWVYLQASKF